MQRLFKISAVILTLSLLFVLVLPETCLAAVNLAGVEALHARGCDVHHHEHPMCRHSTKGLRDSVAFSAQLKSPLPQGKSFQNLPAAFILPQKHLSKDAGHDKITFFSPPQYRLSEKVLLSRFSTAPPA